MSKEWQELCFDGQLWPLAGAEAYCETTRADVESIAARIGRTARERSTSYGAVLEPVSMR